MSYKRVIPRDLFNEANLLKCYGQIALHILDTKFSSNPYFDEPEENEGFLIEQDSSGDTYVANLEFIVNERYCSLRRPLNSRESWPLYLSLWDMDEPIQVFNEDGSFTEDMVNFLNS